MIPGHSDNPWTKQKVALNCYKSASTIALSPSSVTNLQSKSSCNLATWRRFQPKKLKRSPLPVCRRHSKCPRHCDLTLTTHNWTKESSQHAKCRVLILNKQSTAKLPTSKTLKSWTIYQNIWCFLDAQERRFYVKDQFFERSPEHKRHTPASITVAAHLQGMRPASTSKEDTLMLREKIKH